MTWYTLFHQDTGAFIAATPKPTTPTETIGVITTPEEPDLTTATWDAESRSYVALALSRLVLSRKEFLDRLTSTELSGAMALRRSSDLTVFGAIESFVLYVTVSTAIELDDPKVAEGLGFLVTVGVLQPARVPIILAPEAAP
ncbi:MAG TPA: hypothetical protein VE861_00475 [Gemmatimonadaceae bacterium]|nr:hypothetical protein [Gemmatimonadaceae bacterium]